MDLRPLVARWFEAWKAGDYRAIPVTDDFKHTSPFGTVDGRATYLSLVEDNEEQFLGFTLDIEDELPEDVPSSRVMVAPRSRSFPGLLYRQTRPRVQDSRAGSDMTDWPRQLLIRWLGVRVSPRSHPSPQGPFR